MRFKPVILIPSYNNGDALECVLRDVATLALPVIVVNDGCTDGTATILDAWQRDGRVSVVTHHRNRGKAAALRTGFIAARASGFSHAITFDSDGQHDAADVPRMIAASAESPAALVLGTRDERAENYPARSRAGRRISNAFIRLESGARVADSQCGLRVYPLDIVLKLHCRAERYGFETEVLTRAVWAGCEVREVSVTCRYGQPAEHLSHFRPWLDSLRAIPMHARLVARAVAPWPHRKLHASRDSESAGWRSWARWFSPRRAWHELREQPGAPREMATGLAVGVFIANLPIYGLQTLLSLYTARRLHLNPLSVVAGSHISTPPVGPLLIAAAIGVGHFILHGNWLTLPAWPVDSQEWLRLCGAVLLEWTIGALIVGTVLAAAIFCVSNVLLRLVAVQRSVGAKLSRSCCAQREEADRSVAPAGG